MSDAWFVMMWLLVIGLGVFGHLADVDPMWLRWGLTGFVAGWLGAFNMWWVLVGRRTASPTDSRGE